MVKDAASDERCVKATQVVRHVHYRGERGEGVRQGEDVYCVGREGVRAFHMATGVYEIAADNLRCSLTFPAGRKGVGVYGVVKTGETCGCQVVKGV